MFIKLLSRLTVMPLSVSFVKSKIVIVLLVTSLLISNVTHAFVVSGFSWPNATTTFFASPNSVADTELSSAQVTTAFNEALNQWSNMTAFTYKAENGSPDPCTTNTNSYTFAPTNCGTSFSSSTLAVATTFFRSGGTATRSRIVFNSNKSWNITGVSSGAGSDFRRVAVHELGHSLGLDHTTISPAIMRPNIGSVQVPQADDLNGVEAVYGEFVDSDGDGIGDDVDNCVDDSNPDQANFDNDGQGDVCDDSDSDNVFDDVDNCRLTSNPNQADFNNDGQGDVCDNSDGDSLLDSVDNCPTVSNQNQADFNNDGQGDVCDNSDNDSLLDSVDNCPSTTNQNQADLDGDGDGDLCDNDADGDSVLNGADDDFLNRFICSDSDNDSCDDCSSGIFNTANDGPDSDADGICDFGEIDDDADGVEDDLDNCPFIANSDQLDSNNNGVGNACEDDQLCLPIKTSNNTVAVICL